MNPFSYIFYRISCIYVKTGIETQRPDIFASGLITLFQGFNIITILHFIFSIKMTTYSWIYIAVPLMILNWIFLNSKNLIKLQQRWKMESISKKKVKWHIDNSVFVNYNLLFLSGFVSNVLK